MAIGDFVAPSSLTGLRSKWCVRAVNGAPGQRSNEAHGGAHLASCSQYFHASGMMMARRCCCYCCLLYTSYFFFSFSSLLSSSSFFLASLLLSFYYYYITYHCDSKSSFPRSFIHRIQLYT